MDVVVAAPKARKAHTFLGYDEKRRIVEETLGVGVSVSAVARRHGINANQVFQWRKLYREGALESCPAGEVRLLPVTVSDGSSGVIAGAPLQDHACDHGSAGLIEMMFDWGRLRISGAVDGETLRTALGCLLT